MAESAGMRSLLAALSLLAAAGGIAAFVLTLRSEPPAIGLRLVSCVILMDQASLTFLYLRLPAAARGIRLGLTAACALGIAMGAILLVVCSLPHAGPMEIAMPAVGVAMIAHGAITLRYLQSAPAETA
jgi:hypothetical protein